MARSLRCRLGIKGGHIRREPDVEPYFERTGCRKVRVYPPQTIDMGGG
jgi:hypothetical protein